ncbi:hypothetical protein QTP70_012629 [Hemibagrus guttatus]|uniref:Tc1-like transposase DDE domain-containing protein n=1 Tax=Hemibagrus guttatus TaxID=175788 RepID=A0AAE0QBQ4_9TELE|nr:hypothetical protein QTP70_012629 [Hemibagrus guttatus]
MEQKSDSTGPTEALLRPASNLAGLTKLCHSPGLKSPPDRCHLQHLLQSLQRLLQSLQRPLQPSIFSLMPCPYTRLWEGSIRYGLGPGRLAVINGTMNSAVYQKILKENVRPSVCDLKLKQTWVLQQDNDPKHTSKSTSEWLKKNKMKTLEWPSQSPDLNPIEMLWHDLKKVVHARKPSNVAELQQFCKDEWAKIPPQRCNRLIASYRKRLIAVVAAKGGPTGY